MGAGDDHDGVFRKPRLKLVFGQDVDGVMEFEECMEGALELVELAVPGREDTIHPVPKGGF
jgi:hypothetical protein